MSTPNNNDPRRDAHKDREDYIKSQLTPQRNMYEQSMRELNNVSEQMKGLNGIKLGQSDEGIIQTQALTNDGGNVVKREEKKDGEVMPTTTATTTATVKEGEGGDTPVEDKQETLADYYAKLAQSIYGDADRERDEKKKKAAQWITAAQMLGDSLSALGNSIAVRGGANNMGTSQGAQKAAEATYKLNEDIRNAREKAARAELEGKIAQYKDAWERKKHEDAMEMSNKKLKQDAEQFDRTMGFKDKQLLIEKAISEAKIDNDKAALALKSKEYNLENLKYSNQTQSRDYYFDGLKMTMPHNFNDKTSVANIYGLIPQEYRGKYEKRAAQDKYGIETTSTYYPDIETMMTAITEYSDYPSVSNALRAKAGLEPLTNEEIRVRREKYDTIMPGVEQ